MADDPLNEIILDCSSKGEYPREQKNVAQTITAMKNEFPADMTLLPQSHPLMQKFQSLLKEHLLRAKAQLIEQIADVKYEFKNKVKLREDAGIKLYDMQEALKQQQIQIQEFEEEVRNQMDMRNEEEQLIEKLQNELNSKQEESKIMEKMYKKRMRELEQINELEGNTKNWVAELDDSVKNAKRVANRENQMQIQLNEEKHRSDLLFFRLDMEVKKRKKELADLKEDLANMMDVREVLCQSLSNANNDLTVLQNEHKHLAQCWREVIVSISHRDKIMDQLRKTINKEEEDIKNSEFAIIAIKKQIVIEKGERGKLEAFKLRLVTEFNQIKAECTKLNQVLQALETKLQELPVLLEAADKELQDAKKEGIMINTELSRILWRIDKHNKIKFEIEEEVLKTAQDHLVADKAGKYRLKILQNAQDQRRSMDLNITQAQNTLATALVEIEVFKGNIMRLNHENNKHLAILNDTQKDFDNANNVLKDTEMQIHLKLRHIEKLNKQANEIQANTNMGGLGSQTERKIKLLDKAIQVAEQKIREHQQFWLMMQNHFVNLSNKRSEQLTEIQATGKQLSILKQKALKIDTEVYKAESEMRELNREIQVSNKKVVLLNARVHTKEQQHEAEEEDCLQQHNNLLDNLRDKEMEVLNLEETINELKDDIVGLKDLVLDKHREALAWETQYKMVEETLHWRKDQKSKDNELNVMKAEIHRMQIRHQQLRRAQEKLMQDLEYTVVHRETIFNNEARRAEIESRIQLSKAKTSVQTQVNDMRNKIKVRQNEIRQLSDIQIVKLNNDYARITAEIEGLRKELNAIETSITELSSQINEAVLQKHINIELIVREQNRVKAYKKILNKEIPLRFGYTENNLNALKHKAIEYNDNMQDAVQMLINDFPERSLFLNKILNLLKL